MNGAFLSTLLGFKLEVSSPGVQAYSENNFVNSKWLLKATSTIFCEILSEIQDLDYIFKIQEAYIL